MSRCIGLECKEMGAAEVEEWRNKKTRRSDWDDNHTYIITPPHASG
jgi:hypothetical protein